MASILRSSKFVRYFAGFARNIAFNTTREVDNNFVQQSQCLCSSLTQGFATSVTPLRPTDANLEQSLRKIDQDVKRSGRISRRDIEEILEEIRHSRSPTSSQSLIVIRYCGNLVPEELPEVRTQLVQEIWRTLNNLNVPMDVSHYNALLRVYLENEHPFSPTEFLADLESKGVEPNRVTYQRLISRYCQQGDIEGATRILEYMREKQLPVNENVFNALIMGHSNADDLESAKGILSVMSQAGLEPSADTYTTLLCGFARKGDMDSIKSAFEQCDAKDIYLLDKDYMDILYALTINGHGKQANVILDRTRKSTGYNQDAVNLILRLVNKGYEDVGLKVLKTMIRTSKPDGQLNIVGAFFIKQLIKAKRPIEKIMEICKELEKEELNPRATSLAVEFGLQLGDVSMAVPLLAELKNAGLPVRHHYFWPLICAQGKLQNDEGVLGVLKQMSEFDIHPNSETIRDYVIDNLQEKKPDKIVALLRSVGVSTASASSSVVVNLLNNGRIKEAADIAMRYRARHSPNLIRKPLIISLRRTKDVESYINILRQVYENLDRFDGVNANTQNETEGEAEVEGGGNKTEIIGQFLYDVVIHFRNNQFGVIEEVLNGLVNQGLGISNNLARRIEDRLGEQLTEQVSTLLGKLTSGDLEPVALKPGQISSTQLDQAQLERLINTLNAKGENAKGLKRQLLSAYCRNKNLEKASDLIKELQAEDFTFTGGVYAQIIELYCHHDKLDEALIYMDKLKSQEPDFALDDTKVIRLVTLLFKSGRSSEALSFIKEQSRERKLEEKSFAYNSLCWRLLNSVAETGNVEELKNLFDTLLNAQYIEVSNIMLGPLIKVHLINNDLQAAVDQFEWACNQYRATPWKNELACKLIQAEDATNLQKLTDLSTSIHGEVNSLYDLVFAFVECGRVRQARKILETPGLRSRPQRLNSACERYRQEGLVQPLEGLVEATKDMNHINRDDIYYNLLLSYCKSDDSEKALNLWTKIQEENEQASDQFLYKLGTYLKSKNLEVPFVLPEPTEANIVEEVLHQKSIPPKVPSRTPRNELRRKVKEPTFTAATSGPLSLFRQALRDGDVDHALEIKSNLNTNDKLSIIDQSALVEAFVKIERYNDASKIVMNMLQQDTHPIARVFRFYLNKLATSGDVETMDKIGASLSPEIKKLVSFDNRLCHANITAGKADDYVKKLEDAIDAAKDEDLKYLGEKFPRGGAIGVLENHPELCSQFEKMANKYAARGIVAPINVLWMQHFISNNKEEADRIWEKHLVNSPRLMFQRIVHIARERNDENLAQRLIEQLKKTKVSEGAVGNAYSCLLDVLVAQEKYDEAVECLKKGINDVCLENINKTALVRIQAGLEKSGKSFPFEIPAKAGGKISSTSQSSSSDDEKVRSSKQ